MTSYRTPDGGSSTARGDIEGYTRPRKYKDLSPEEQADLDRHYVETVLKVLDNAREMQVVADRQQARKSSLWGRIFR